MNRKLLTGLTLATVVGTGGAAYATVAGPADTTPAAASAGPLVTAGDTSTSASAATTSTSATAAVASTTAVTSGRTISYQVGDAGTVTVEVAESVLTSRGLVPAGGWTIGAMSNSGAHIDVQFANAELVVGFSADLVGTDVVVSVTNDRLPGALGPIDPLVVSVIVGSGAPTVPASTNAQTTAPAPATAPSFDTVVPATPAPAPVIAPTPVAPRAASTSAPSSAGTSGDDDGEYASNEGVHSSYSGESEGGDDD